MGVVLLLRRSSEDEPEDDDDDSAKDGRKAPRTSDAVRALGLALVGLTVSFGLYIVTHGAVSPRSSMRTVSGTRNQAFPNGIPSAACE